MFATIFRHLSFDGELKNGTWVPIKVLYSGTSVNRFSHLRVSILPLKKCTKDNDTSIKVFCKPCEGEQDADCCNPLGDCDLRYKGECSPKQMKILATPVSAIKTDNDPREIKDYPTEGENIHQGYSRDLQNYRTPTLAKPSCRVGGQPTCASAVVGKGFLSGSIFSHEHKAIIPMCCVSKPTGYQWHHYQKAPVSWSLSVRHCEINSFQCIYSALRRTLQILYLRLPV